MSDEHHRNRTAAVALRTGEPVWLESRAERDRRFPELAGLEASTVSLCAVPLVVLCVLFGVAPALILNWMEPSVTQIIDTLATVKP